MKQLDSTIFYSEIFQTLLQTAKNSVLWYLDAYSFKIIEMRGSISRSKEDVENIFFLIYVLKLLLPI